jgi:hypothetical protein
MQRLIERERTLSRFTLEDFCGKHAPQLAFCKDRSPYIHAKCARQSGKTQGDGGVVLDNGLTARDSTNLFLGLNGTAVRTAVWEPVWKRLFDRYQLPDWHNETRMLTAFPNGARALFAGTDDLRHVKSYLGNRLANGVVIIDECQDQSDQVLKYILQVLLPPMLTSTSRVILSGVLPDVPAGYFYELSKAPGWSHHSWGRAANVHTPDWRATLDEYMRLNNLTEDDPQIQRDWFMKEVWDLAATAYRYDRERNGYQAEAPAWVREVSLPLGVLRAAVPHPGIERFSVGADPGGQDRTSVVCWGWGETTTEVQQVFEWVTPRNTKTSLSDIAAAMAVCKDRFDPEAYFWDPGSGSMEIDTFGNDWGLPIVKAAIKADMPGQVRRNNDLLTRGLLKVIIGGAVEEDYQKARWDPEARRRAQWKWASQWHPDPSEAGRYALQGYYDAYQAPEAQRDVGAQMAYAARHRNVEEDDDPLGLMDDDD